MNKPWHAELEVTCELAATLIKQQFPSLSDATVTVLGSGWDNTAFLINDNIVFRFPRRDEGATLMRHEIDLLPMLKGKFSLHIPELEYIGHPDKTYPWYFAGYPKVHGVTACCANLSVTARIKNVERIATFLAKLHAFSVDVALKHGAILQSRGRLEMSERIPVTLENINILEQEKLLSGNPFISYLKKISDLPLDKKSCLTHGDLYAKHLIVDDADNVTGVIDWN